MEKKLLTLLVSLALPTLYLFFIFTIFVVAAMKLLKMSNLDAVPDLPGVNTPLELWTESAEKRKDVLLRLCGDVVDKFILFQYNSTPKNYKDKVRSNRTSFSFF